MMKGKHAYLIMAHHRFDVLKMLLTDLDYEDNDIFLHIDRKTKDVPTDELKACVRKSRLVLIERIPVYWGHFSQTRCVLNLLKAATETSHYDYYHLLVGVEFPLMTQDRIHRFFDENQGKEFIGFADGVDIEKRVKYYYFWWKYIRGGNAPHQKLLFWREGSCSNCRRSLASAGSGTKRSITARATPTGASRMRWRGTSSKTAWKSCGNADTLFWLTRSVSTRWYTTRVFTPMCMIPKTSIIP